ncbi:MAG TPA: hypothetical protein VH325_05845 [Bryobacteraceae bacterium]|nr:hypothetical protein [Bryobacteraceae bacterium]
MSVLIQSSYGLRTNKTRFGTSLVTSTASAFPVNLGFLSAGLWDRDRIINSVKDASGPRKG